jgi:hypothetical protein
LPALWRSGLLVKYITQDVLIGALFQTCRQLSHV